MNLNDLFQLSLRGRADSIALEFGGRAYTFADLDARSNRMAGVLLGRGLAAGDRLAVYLANCVEMIDLYLACVKQGIIFVPINILYREREISHILADAEPKAVIAREPNSGERGLAGRMLARVSSPELRRSPAIHRLRWSTHPARRARRRAPS